MILQDGLILFDYLSFTTKIHSPVSLLEFMGLDFDAFRPMPGARGYEQRLYYEGISIHAGNRDEIWCEMSGQGCRTFESFGNGAWDTLFEEIQSDRDNYHLTRLDVAYDDREGLLDLDVLAHETQLENYASHIQDWEIVRGRRSGVTVYLGSKKSDMFIRIYDKAKERGREDEGHWVRFELQMREKKAGIFLDFMVLRTIGETFSGVVNNYIRYVIPNESDSRKRRWITAAWWQKFIDTAERLSLYRSPGTEYNLSKAKKYVYGQAGAAAGALLEIEGEEEFLDALRAKLQQSNNPKYRDLVRKYVHES